VRPSHRRPRLLPLRHHPIPRWLLAAVLAGAAAAIVASTTARAERTVARYGELRAVAVAARDIVAGQRLGRADVTVSRLPAALVPDGAMTGDAAGQVAVVAIYAGEVVLAARLAPAGLSGTAALVPTGHRAIAVPIDTAAGLALEVGDAVDVLIALDPSSGASEPAITVARRAPVVAVADASVTVAVRASEAPRLAFAITQGTAVLALVGA
jgi:Flp pilus assembly protein CpaB